jgi:hypothetical protein
LKKSQFEEIKSLKEKVSDQPIINFEVAYLNEQWNEVLELKSQVAMNDRKTIKSLMPFYILEKKRKLLNLRNNKALQT